MIRLPKKWLIYAAFLAALLVLAGIGVTAAKALWPAAAVHPANGDSNPVFDADYETSTIEGIDAVLVCRRTWVTPTLVGSPRTPFRLAEPQSEFPEHSGTLGPIRSGTISGTRQKSNGRP